jgi:hypothetical protein
MGFGGAWSSNIGLYVTRAGNVGIGTYGPNSLMNLQGNSPVLNIENTNAGTNNGGVLRFGHFQDTDRKPIAEIRAVLQDGSPSGRAGDLAFYTSASGTLTKRMIIVKEGNVGSGADNPTLNSNGKFIHIHSDTTSTAAASHYTNADTGNAATDGLVVGYWNDNSAYLWNYENTPLKFGTNSLERMRIDAAGNVGIGTTTPTAKLNVSGDILASGNVTAYSDSRFKEDINTIEHALEKTKELNGVNYTDKETKQRRMGLIAQEVKEVIPEVVSINGEEQIHSLAYGNIVGLLVEAIKELNAKVDVLSIRIDELTNKKES